jgi:hypothetical protein
VGWLLASTLLATEGCMSESNQSNTIMWNALTKKCADMILEIEQGEKRVAELKAQLLHLDATLRISRPDFAEEGLPARHRRRTKSPYFEHGELTARIYDLMREKGTISSADVGVKAMRDKGLWLSGIDSYSAILSRLTWTFLWTLSTEAGSDRKRFPTESH